MIRWLLALVFLLFTVWFAAGWYLADRILTGTIRDYDEADELELLDELGYAAIDRRAVRFTSGDVAIAGSFFRNPQPNNCAVVVIPGIGGNRTQVLPILPLFWELDCHVLAYDPRGTGASARVPRSLGFFEAGDNVAAIKWLAAQTGLPETSIGIWGPSLGAAIGLETLEILPEFGFVVADSTFAGLGRIADETFAQLSNEVVSDLITPLVLTLLEVRTGMRVDDVAPAYSIAGSSTPVLLVHAVDDPDISVEHSRSVYQNRTTDLVELKITDWGAGHADSALVDPARYALLVRGFLAGHDRTRHLVHPG